jgi:glyoxylase-like metal-dependent hydrolase (beta-lactamase superfamily II)
MSSTDRTSLEARLHYPLGSALPHAESVIDVADGLRWVRMGLPFALNHINLWLLRDAVDGTEGWSVVDCGVDLPESRAQWEWIFKHALDDLPIVRVIVTHMHPDHIGLADWLCQRWTTPVHTCRLWMSATDHLAARTLSQQAPMDGRHGMADFFASHGMTDPEQLNAIRGRANYYPNLVPSVPRQYRRLQGGDRVRIGGRDWRCMAGYGHAPEHMALFDSERHLLISGDMVLPRISTNVSVYESEPEGDPLRLFLTSLNAYTHLPDDTVVLPSHGQPFVGLHERLKQLHDHHRDRLAELLQACQAQAMSAADAVPVLFQRKLDVHQTTFAMGEAIAHLNALWHRESLQRERDAAGVWRFRAV